MHTPELFRVAVGWTATVIVRNKLWNKLLLVKSFKHAFFIYLFIGAVVD